MKINKLISERWSPVIFSDKPVDTEILYNLFEAARWAPSSFNAQPWKFIWASKGDSAYPILFDLINENNRRWAKSAPVLVLSISEIISPGRSTKNRFAMYDTGMAVGNLLAEATSVGLLVHQMGGYDNIRAKVILNLPETYEPMAMMAIGYKGHESDYSNEIINREKKVRERKPIEGFVFNGKL